MIGGRSAAFRFGHHPITPHLAYMLVQKRANDRHDFLAVCFQRKVAGIVKTDVGLRDVAAPGLGAGRQEKRIVLSPNS